MMQQYMAIKDDYKDAILMYRLGDFYEMFFDDAILVSRELELTLTGSLRNLMGPYHCVGGEFNVMGPATFSGRHSWPNLEPGDNDWYEKRKTGSARLWRDDYYCIPFGLMENPVLMLE